MLVVNKRLEQTVRHEIQVKQSRWPSGRSQQRAQSPAPKVGEVSPSLPLLAIISEKKPPRDRKAICFDKERRGGCDSTPIQVLRQYYPYLDSS